MPIEAQVKQMDLVNPSKIKITPQVPALERFIMKLEIGVSAVQITHTIYTGEMYAHLREQVLESVELYSF